MESLFKPTTTLTIQADGAVLNHVFYDMNSVRKTGILKNLFRALKPYGKVVLIDPIRSKAFPLEKGFKARMYNRITSAIKHSAPHSKLDVAFFAAIASEHATASDRRTEPAEHRFTEPAELDKIITDAGFQIIKQDQAYNGFSCILVFKKPSFVH